MAIEGDILERILVAIVFKQMPVWKYRGFLCSIWQILAVFWNCEIFESDISLPQMTDKKKKNYCETALLLMSKKLFSFRSFSKFCGCASLLIAWVILMTSSPK